MVHNNPGMTTHLCFKLPQIGFSGIFHKALLYSILKAALHGICVEDFWQLRSALLKSTLFYVKMLLYISIILCARFVGISEPIHFDSYNYQYIFSQLIICTMLHFLDLRFEQMEMYLSYLDHAD